MTINNQLITLSIILFRTEEGEAKCGTHFTATDFLLWDHRTDKEQEIELSGLKGKHMLDISNEEREVLWLSIFKKELSNLLNIDLESSDLTYNLYLNTLVYNTKGGRYISNCVVPFNSQLNWSEIFKAEKEYMVNGATIENGASFLKNYYELINSPVYSRC
jgi:hypothetical protein